MYQAKSHKTIIRKIGKMIKEQKMTHLQFAQKIGMNIYTLRNRLNNKDKANPSIKMIIEMLNYLERPTIIIMDKENENMFISIIHKLNRIEKYINQKDNEEKIPYRDEVNEIKKTIKNLINNNKFYTEKK